MHHFPVFEDVRNTAESRYSIDSWDTSDESAYTTMEENDGDGDDRGICFVPQALCMLCERIFPLFFQQGFRENSWYHLRENYDMEENYGYDTETVVSQSSDSSSAPSMCYSDYSDITFAHAM